MREGAHCRLPACNRMQPPRRAEVDHVRNPGLERRERSYKHASDFSPWLETEYCRQNELYEVDHDEVDHVRNPGR